MNRAECSAYSVAIYIAGDADVARQVCREHCYAVGLSVTVTPTSFIYTGGEEAGVIVGLINYARFPADPDALWSKAEVRAELLIDRLCQHSASIVGPDRSIWLSRREG